MKDYAKGFYKSKRWRDTQAAYMISQHYICERCEDMARVVHHIQYITPNNIHDLNVTLSWDNLEALCMACHANEHSSGDICAEGISFNSNGEIVYTPHKGKQ